MSGRPRSRIAKHKIEQTEADRIKRLCQVHKQIDVARIVGRSEATIARLKVRGFVAGFQPRRKCPDDFRLYADELTKPELCRHYRASLMTINRWIAERGRNFVRAGEPRRKANIPADLADTVKRLGPKAAAQHYGVARDTIRYWRHKVGIRVRPNWNRREDLARAAKVAA